jgi:hypothetical protein
VATAGEHLEGSEIGERNAHRFGRRDAIGDRHEKPTRADRILGIATDDAEIGDHLALVRRSHAEPRHFHDTNDLIARRKRYRPLEVWIAAASDHCVGEAGAGGEHLDADLPRARIGDGRLFDEF